MCRRADTPDQLARFAEAISQELFGQLQLVPGTLIVLAVNLPWFITMYALHGEEFKNHLLGAEIRDRLIHDTPFGFYYIGVFFRYYQPWALFFVSAVFVCTGFASFSPAASGANRTGSRLPGNIRSALAKLLEPDSMPLLFCFLWLALTTVLFTLVRIEHSRYMLPASPAIAMIVAHFFVNLAQSESGFRRPLFQIPFWMTIFFYFAITAVLGIAVLVFDKSLRVPFEIMFLPLTIAVGASCLILLFIARKWILLVAALALFQLTILAPVTGSAIPFFNLHPMKKFAETIRETGNGSETIAVYRLGNHRPRLGILTGQTTLLFGQPEDLEKFLDTDRQVFVVMREVEWDNAFKHLPLVRLASDGPCRGMGRSASESRRRGVL